MTTETKTAQFARGDEYVHRPGREPGVGDWPAIGVIEEIAEDWVSFRYHGEDEIHVFGEHPQAIGTLDELRPVTR